MILKKLIIQFCLIFSFISIYPTLVFAQDQVNEDSAVIIMYHRFGEDTFPTTNVTLTQIEQHLEELSKDIYNVVPLRTITDAFKSGKKLPPRTIAITIDDGFLSIYEEAWPRLKAAGVPFTLFISTQPVDEQFEGSMTWDQVRELDADPLVEIGHHGHSHAHMTEISVNDAMSDIAAADTIFQQELGYIPDLFAFPFGEYSDNLIDALKEKKYHAGFAQYSSTSNSDNNIMAIPRFAFNQSFSDIDRFKLIVNSRALPVRDVLPRSADLEQNPPSVGFTIAEDIQGLSALNCFPSHMSEPATVNRIGTNRIEIRFDEPFPTGRHRINCTLPGPSGRWYWYGMPFFNLENSE